MACHTGFKALQYWGDAGHSLDLEHGELPKLIRRLHGSHLRLEAMQVGLFDRSTLNVLGSINSTPAGQAGVLVRWCDLKGSV